MMHRRLGKLLLYFLVPALGAVAPLIVIPSITGRFGAEGWASIAIAMALGNAGAVLAECGWGVVGPQRVAREPARARDVYRDALGSKLIAFALVGTVVAILAWMLVPEHKLAATLLAVSLVANCFTPAWYFIGLGQPQILLAVESVPRFVLASAAALLIAAGWPLEVYGLALALAVAVVLLLSSAIGKTPIRPTAWVVALQTLRSQAVLVLGRGISTLYTSLPAAILATVAPQSVAVFSAVDRPLRMGLSILSGVPARLQAWIGSPDENLRNRRARLSLGINAAVGVVAGFSFTLGMPLIAPILFSGAVEIDLDLSALGGFLVLAICASRGFGLALVAVERANSITFAVSVAAPVGAIGVLALGTAYGAAGALLALVVAEGVGIVVQAIRLLRAPR